MVKPDDFEEFEFECYREQLLMDKYGVNDDND